MFFKQSSPLLIFRLRSPSRWSSPCRPSSASARACRSPGSPRSAGQRGHRDRARESPHGADRSPALLFVWPRTGPTDPRLPVVGGGLVEGLAELEADLGGFEGALGLHAHDPLLVHAHDQVGLGPVPHLAGGEAHTCGDAHNPRADNPFIMIPFITRARVCVCG